VLIKGKALGLFVPPEWTYERFYWHWVPVAKSWKEAGGKDHADGSNSADQQRLTPERAWRRNRRYFWQSQITLATADISHGGNPLEHHTLSLCP
jgi:hypothetical protein